MKPNMLLNIAGISLIIIAVAGLAVHEEPQPIIPEKFLEKKYSVLWVEDKIGGKGAEGKTDDGSTDEGYIEVNETNITEVKFTISTADSHPYPMFSTVKTTVTIVSPDGDEKSVEIDESSSGTVSFNISTLPDISEVSGKNKDDAFKNLMKKCPPIHNGTGSWYYSVSVERDYLSPVGVIGAGVSWKIDVEIQVYHAEIGEENERTD